MVVPVAETCAEITGFLGFRDGCDAAVLRVAAFLRGQGSLRLERVQDTTEPSKASEPGRNSIDSIILLG